MFKKEIISNNNKINEIIIGKIKEGFDFIEIFNSLSDNFSTQTGFVDYFTNNIIPNIDTSILVDYFVECYKKFYSTRDSNEEINIRWTFMWKSKYGFSTVSLWKKEFISIIKIAFDKVLKNYYFVSDETYAALSLQIKNSECISINYPIQHSKYGYTNFLKYYFNNLSEEDFRSFSINATENILAKEDRTYVKESFAKIFKINNHGNCLDLFNRYSRFVKNHTFNNGTLYAIKPYVREKIIDNDGHLIDIQKIIEAWRKMTTDEIYDTLNLAAQKFIEKRIKFSATRLMEILYNLTSDDSNKLRDVMIYDSPNRGIIISKIEITTEYVNNKLIANNEASMKKDTNEWRIFYHENTNVRSITIPFNNQIPSKLLKEIRETLIKMYIHDDASRILTMANAAKNIQSILVKNNLDSIESITDTMIEIWCHDSFNDGIKLHTIKTNLTSIRMFLEEWYLSNSPEKINPALLVRIHNAHKSVKHKSIMPEEIRLQLEEYKNELPLIAIIYYELMYQTGCRFSCFHNTYINDIHEYDDSLGYATIDFIPNKVSQRREKNNTLEKYTAYITKELFENIKEYIKQSNWIREKHHTDKLFVNESTRKQLCDINSRYITNKINDLIIKHDIRTLDGKLWIFETGQQRKTSASDLISSGSSILEVQNFLHHATPYTTEVYYAEVNQNQLLKKNTEFFRKKFVLHMDNETYKQLTEKERQMLYLDYLDNEREVELGKCCRKMSDGLCSTYGNTSCANCPKLITGKKYLDKWNKLLDSTQKQLDKLVELYAKHGILEAEYSTYREFKQILNQYNNYKAVVDAIMEADKNE